MDFSELVPRLKEMNTQHIVVTGPQRSGTTIATQMLAQALVFRPVLEEAIGHTNIVKLATLFKNDQGDRAAGPGVVIRCPLAALHRGLHASPCGRDYHVAEADQLAQRSRREGDVL